jgi:hypothetical protein
MHTHPLIRTFVMVTILAIVGAVCRHSTCPKAYTTANTRKAHRHTHWITCCCATHQPANRATAAANSTAWSANRPTN